MKNISKADLELLCNQGLALSKIAKAIGCRTVTVKELLLQYEIEREPLKRSALHGKHRNKVCPICGKVFDDVYKNDKTYCSSECLQESYYRQYIERWLAGLEDGMRGPDGISSYIRRYLIEKHNNACQKCGWSQVNPTTGNVPLTINHVDGDHTNNRPENLELLCPNCHSLTPNYGSLNKGNGRKSRRNMGR